MNIFVGRDSRHGGFVHLNVIGNITQDHGLNMSWTLIEELSLMLHDALSDFVDRSLALVNRLDQPNSSPKLVLNVLLGLVAGRFVTFKMFLYRLETRSLGRPSSFKETMYSSPTL